MGLEHIPGGWVTAVCTLLGTVTVAVLALRKHWDGAMLQTFSSEMAGLRLEMQALRVENADLRKEVREVRAELDVSQNVAAERERKLVIAEIDNQRLAERLAMTSAHVLTLEADVAREKLMREAAEARAVLAGP